MKSRDFDQVKPYVYWIKNLKTGIKYIGSRYGNIRLKLTPNQDLGLVYFSSGKLKEEFERFPDQFKTKLIATFDTPKEATDYETLLTKKIYKQKRYANLASYPAVIQTDEVRKKISKTLTGIKRSYETRKKIAAFQTGRTSWNKGKKLGKRSLEIREKISRSQKGKIKSEETRRKLSIANTGKPSPMKGIPRSEETKKKMSKSLTGKKASDEARKKISKALTGRKIPREVVEKVAKALRGIPRSEEVKLKISLAQKGRKKGPMSEEIKRQISLTLKGRKRGPMSEEAKRKISLALKGKKYKKR